MSPERWQVVKELFHECADLNPEVRRTALETMTDDEAIRSEVERLLHNLEQADPDFLTAPDAVRRTLRASTGLLNSGDLLAGRFRVVRLIGSGGMGEVYEGFDEDLQERLAIKVLCLPADAAPCQAGSQGSVRFRRELQLARRVTHPNVCRLFEINRHAFPWGEVEFFTMELLEGQTLSQALKERGRFSVAETQAILTQVLAGLEAAHATGIVHRDLKPGNIMLTGLESGTPKAVLMDFGLARAGDGDTGTRLTSTGNILGTLAYISPEELTGGAITPRTDLYSFGLIWFEMLTGERPFQAGSSVADAVQRLQTPVRLDRTQGIPPVWRQGIEQCLERDPVHRPADAAAVRAIVTSPSAARSLTLRLRRAASARSFVLPNWATAVALVLIAAGGAASYPPARKSVRQWFSPVPRVRHVALLPFQSAREEDAATTGVVVADAVATQLVRAEAGDKDFWLVSASDLRAQNAKTFEAAKKAFPVNLVVRSSMTRDTRRIVVTSAVVEASTGRTLASKEIVSSVDEVFRLSGLVTDGISDMLRLNIPDNPARESGTNVAEAYRAYEAGRAAFTERSVEGADRAIAELQRAVELDSHFASAYAALAEAYAQKSDLVHDPALAELADENADRAVSLAPGLPEVHRSLALVHAIHGQSEAAVTELKRALQLDPVDAESHQLLGTRYRDMGRLADAETEYRRALALRPSYWSAHNRLGSLYFSQARYREAEVEYRKVVDVLPLQTTGLYNLGAIYAITGDCGRAIPVFRRSVEIKPTAGAYTNLGTCEFQLGNYSQAAADMQRAAELNPREHVIWRNLGDALRMIPGREAGAADAYRRALDAAASVIGLNGHDVRALSGAVLYAAKLGDRNLSETYRRRVEAENRVDVNARFRLAVADELNGNRKRALRALADAFAGGLALSEADSAWELGALRATPEYRDMRVSLSNRGDRK